MTPEEQRQVQNIINSRTRLLNEQISQQEEKITYLSYQLAAKSEELDYIKEQLTESQQLNSALQAELQQLKAQPAQPAVLPLPAQEIPQEQPRPQKPSYLASLLRQHFAINSFRPGQEEAIDAILSGMDLFCSMPEHYGLTICFRLPALLMPGLTLVVINSEDDEPQTDSHSAILSASLTPAKKRALFRDIKSGIIKILYATLERLSDGENLSSLKTCDISLAAALELRKNINSFSEIADFLSKKRITRAVFSHATSPDYRQNIFKLLRSPACIIAGFNRPELALKVVRTEDSFSSLREILNANTNTPGVIYCTTPEETFKLRERLRDYPGIDQNIIILPARLYNNAGRRDIRFTVHYTLPANLAEFAGGVNSAGQDGSPAKCFLIAQRKALVSADGFIVKFCSSKDPKAFLLEYLGQDDNFNVPQEQEQKDGLIPEDFADFDFGTANDAQKEAVTSTAGPLLIIAGPGTGKTYTLIQRAVFLIQKKRVKPENIMLATFTDKAANELSARIAEALAAKNIRVDTSAMYLGTFHAICTRILREYADFTDVDKTFTILDDFGHAFEIMKEYKKFAELPGFDSIFKTSGKWRRSCELRDYINTLSEELVDPEELMFDPLPGVSALGRSLLLHDKIMKAKRRMSYSMLLADTYKLLSRNPEILADIQSKIKYIMIDEYQDTNYIQEQLVFLLGSESRNICVVGDDDQSLYRFRGATVRNILEFPRKWANDECKIVRLMINYRSSPAIIEFASQWMDDTGEFFSWADFRYAKKLEAYKPAAKTPAVIRLAEIGDVDGWHEKILAFITSLRNSSRLTDYSQIAFLFRSVRAKNVQTLAQFLEKNGISVYSPRSNLFFSRPEIKFAIGCLIAMFPSYTRELNAGNFQRSDYYKDCLQNVSRFIHRPVYSTLKKHILRRQAHHERLKTGYTNYTYSGLLYELFAFEPFSNALGVDTGENVKDLRPARNLARLVQVFRDYERSYGVNNIKAEKLSSQFEMMMNIYVRFRIDEGLDEYESDIEDIPAGHVAFMTIHQAKGKEFPIVFVDSLWAVPDPNLPQDRNEELMRNISANHSRRSEFEPADAVKFFDFWRMYYVAFTRAQNLLVLTCNENRSTPSRYFEEAYDRLEDADDVFKPSEIELEPQKDSGTRKKYSFTADILTYESCPMQYKFFRELEFPQAVSPSTLLGKLVHLTIEDIHKAVLNHDEAKLTEPNISEWLADNYQKMKANGEGYLNESAQRTAFAQVMHYVHLQGNDWSGIAAAEADVDLMRPEYILEGRIDLIRICDGLAEIIDFKSGAKPNMNINKDRKRLEDCRRQVNVYAYLAAKSLGLKVSGMRLHYTGDDTTTPEIIYPYDEREAERVVSGFDSVVSKIAGENFAERTEDLETCGECPFKYYCGKEALPSFDEIPNDDGDDVRELEGALPADKVSLMEI